MQFLNLICLKQLSIGTQSDKLQETHRNTSTCDFKKYVPYAVEINTFSTNHPFIEVLKKLDTPSKLVNNK